MNNTMDYDRTRPYLEDPDINKPTPTSKDWKDMGKVQYKDSILKIWKNELTGYHVAVDNEDKIVFLKRDYTALSKRLKQ